LKSKTFYLEGKFIEHGILLGTGVHLRTKRSVTFGLWCLQET